MRDLDSSCHSVYSLYYHLVLIIKYRVKILDKNKSKKLKEMFLKIQDDYGIMLVEWNYEKDHVHILFTAKPNTNLSKFIGVYKSMSSRLIKKYFPQIKRRLWTGKFWSNSYCLISTGGVSTEVIKSYIKNQRGGE